MQKWEKFLLISLIILGILGGGIGFIITESGFGDMKVLDNIDIFGLLELILSIIVIGCASFDVYETYESKKEFGDTKFKVAINTKNRLKNISIFLILINAFELGVFINSLDIYILPLFFITITLTFLFAFHNRIDNGISDNGILHWGIYHNWEDIKSHNIENETLLKIDVINNFFGFEYINIIKFDFDSSEKTNIEKFLTEKSNDISKQQIV